MTRDPLLARALVLLYPPAWRARYSAELLALIADARLTPRGAASLIRGAAMAWARPPQHLADRPTRVRASLSVALYSYIALVAGLLVYGQLFQDQVRAPGHPATTTLFRVCEVAGVASVAMLAVGLAPLAWHLVRTARGRTDRVLLALPVATTGGFLIVLLVVAHAARSAAGGLSAEWFVGMSVLGLLAGAAGASGPLAVLRRATTSAGPLRLAVLATAAALTLLAVAAIASAANLAAIDSTDLTSVVARVPIGVLAAYAAVLAGVACAATVSTVRAARGVMR